MLTVADVDRTSDKLTTGCITALALMRGRVGSWVDDLEVFRVSERYRAAPGRWTHTDHAAKYFAQMRLVAQSARDRNLGERFSRRTHHRAREFDASTGDVVKGRNADADFECSKQLSDAHVDEIRKVHRHDFLRQMRLDVVDYAVQLPRQQSASGCRWPGALDIRVRPTPYAQECRRAHEIAARGIPIRVEGHHGGIDEARNGCWKIVERVHARSSFSTRLSPGRPSDRSLGAFAQMVVRPMFRFGSESASAGVG
jgi:hypothetical protein